MSISSPPPVFSLWVGASLGPIERACLRSVIRQGHAFTLYCFEDVAGVPAGVTIADAAAIVPPSEIIRHQSGSPSLFSNRFRYEVLRRKLGVWVDCDAYFFAPLPDHDYIFGREDDRFINGGVLRLPADDPILPAMLKLFDNRTIPPWLHPRAKAAALWRRWHTGKAGIDRMPWGVAGPQGLTYMLGKNGLTDRAAPVEAYYPVHWTRADWIRDPALHLDQMITPNTISLHLWNKQISAFKHLPAAAGSFLARLQSEGET